MHQHRKEVRHADLSLNPSQSDVARKGHDELGPKYCHQDKGCADCQGNMEIPRLCH
jgi:hypothetical protein